jgi:hypothetical protein
LLPMKPALPLVSMISANCCPMTQQRLLFSSMMPSELPLVVTARAFRRHCSTVHATRSGLWSAFQTALGNETPAASSGFNCPPCAVSVVPVVTRAASARPPSSVVPAAKSPSPPTLTILLCFILDWGFVFWQEVCLNPSRQCTRPPRNAPRLSRHLSPLRRRKGRVPSLRTTRTTYAIVVVVPRFSERASWFTAPQPVKPTKRLLAGRVLHACYC